MKKPHQHFIPRVYLEQFAHTSLDNKHFVAAYDKINEKLNESISIKDICVETDLYTLKKGPKENRYLIEDFFSNEIESKYPDVYKILVKEKKTILNKQEKFNVLTTTLSMYFRTPKVLNKYAEQLTKLAELLENNLNEKQIDFLGYKISLESKSFKALKKEIKEAHRIDFFKTQLALMDELIRFKFNDGLVVIELVGNQEFITSDNPVEIRNSKEFGFNLFSSKNLTYIPLDTKHALFIAPKDKDTISNQVFYQRDNQIKQIILNNSVFRNSERWILGTKNGLDQFFKDEAIYSQPADPNHPMILKVKRRLNLMNELRKRMENGINNDNIELISFLKELKKDPLFNDSIEIRDIYNQLKEIGLSI